MLNARVIFEVPSPSTAAYDRGEQFDRYRQISPLTDYVLLAQDEPAVEHRWQGVGGEWLSRSYTGLHSRVRLDSIACTLLLSDVYERLGMS